MNTPIVEIKNVSKVLGAGAAQVRALKSVDLSLSGGALTILMGPSGSGKTTLLSILGCLLAPTAGTVRVRGVSTDGAGPQRLAAIRRQHFGYVFQSYHLFPTLTAAENVRTDWRRAPAVSEGTGSLWATAASATAVLEAVTFVEALATAVCMHTAATGGRMMITITDIAAGPIPTTTAATTTVGEESAEATAVT